MANPAQSARSMPGRPRRQCRSSRHPALGLLETWPEDRDGIQIVLVKVPPATLRVAAIGVTAGMTTATRHYAGDQRSHRPSGSA